MPVVVEEARRRGCNVTEMAMSGGCLAMLYALRDADEAPVPAKLLFEMVGPSSFYAEDWDILGLDANPEAAAELFGALGGVEPTPEMISSGAYAEKMRPVSAFMWVDEDACPSVLLYGTKDKVQPWKGVRHLADAPEESGVDCQLFEAPHSGHGVQNDDGVMKAYMETVEEYPGRYLPAQGSQP